MKSTHSILSLITAILVTFAGLQRAALAGQAVMNFSPLPTGTNIYTYTQNGIKLDCFYSDNSQAPLGFSANNNLAVISGGGGAIVKKYRITAASGLSFIPVSMKLTALNIAGTTTVTGTLGPNNTATHTFTNGPNPSGTVGTFPPAFDAGVISLEWTAGSLATSSYIDDITVLLPTKVSAQPAVTLTEATGPIALGVTFDEPLVRPLGLTWNVVGSTAGSPQDFAFNGNATTGSVTIPAGQTSWAQTCTIMNDSVTEPIESFTVSYTLTTPNAYLDTASQTIVQIGNDDGVSNFAGWMSSHGLVGNNALPEADPDSDGVPNIEAWLYRLNPAGPSPATWATRRATFLFDASARPALRLTIPTPLPSDVRLIFEDNSLLSTAWTELARRSGFDVGSLWTGSGSGRITQTGNGGTSFTITCPAAQTLRQRSRAFLRMKYQLVVGNSS